MFKKHYLKRAFTVISCPTVPFAGYLVYDTAELFGHPHISKILPFVLHHVLVRNIDLIMSTCVTPIKGSTAPLTIN